MGRNLYRLWPKLLEGTQSLASARNMVGPSSWNAPE